MISKGGLNDCSTTYHQCHVNDNKMDDADLFPDVNTE